MVTPNLLKSIGNSVVENVEGIDHFAIDESQNKLYFTSDTLSSREVEALRRKTRNYIKDQCGLRATSTIVSDADTYHPKPDFALEISN